jgi:hypothetical protein
LAVTALAGLKGVAGYHTSIVLAGEEYVFTPLGILHWPTITSHKMNPEMKLIAAGTTRYSGIEMLEFLDYYFPPGHYDLVRKNCNSFSDCALYYLCELRLDRSFRQVETLAKLVDDRVGLVQSISGGEYQPNPDAVAFDVETVIREIDAERETCDGGSTEADMEFPDTDRDIFAGFVALPTIEPRIKSRGYRGDYVGGCIVDGVVRTPCGTPRADGLVVADDAEAIEVPAV